MNRSFKQIALGLTVALSALGLMACAATGAPDQGERSGGRDGDPIVNGQETNDYPATGMLLQQGFSFCTGTVVGPRSVVTAAHCVDGQSAGQFTFGFGPSQDQAQNEIQVVDVVQHPQWDSQNLVNDVAVITLAEDAPVQPVELNPSMDDSWIGQKVTLVGYGVSDGPSQSGGGIKRMVAVTIDKLEATTLHYTTTNGQTACNGDSGGPAYADANGQLVIAGITSYGDQSCQQYGVYTRVDAYIDFIKEQIDKAGSGNPNNPDPNNPDPNDPNNPDPNNPDPNDPNNPGNPDPNDPNNPDPGGDPNDPGGTCGGETWEGRCEGDMLIYCEAGQVYQEKCDNGTACAWDDYNGFYNCL